MEIDHTVASHFVSKPYVGAEGTDFEGLSAYVERPAGSKYYAVRFFDGTEELGELNCFKADLGQALTVAMSFADGVER